MPFAHERLPGLPRERLLEILEPVLRAHGVEGVELVWRTDAAGRVLELTLERPGTRIPGAGITVELCSDVSRDLSHALDVADLIPQAYRLEVGSPGLDRALYGASDYERFAGQLARVKLRQPRGGQRVLRGLLQGRDESGAVLLSAGQESHALPLEDIESARLEIDWGPTPRAAARGSGGARPRAALGGASAPRSAPRRAARSRSRGRRAAAPRTRHR
ncbi:MAG: ribosome maturation factor RimP [Polyangiaceae bacterium]|nr:ribosome maturation factor RimP [Polyangiaceae bacterium]